jgi:hypothetical protein
MVSQLRFEQHRRLTPAVPRSARLRRVSRLQPRPQEFRPGNRRIFRRPFGTDAGRQARQDGVGIGIEKNATG